MAEVAVKKKKEVVSKDLSMLQDSVSYLSRKVEGIVKTLEKTFGIDINQDGSVGSAKVAVLTTIASAFIAFSCMAGSMSDIWGVGPVYVDSAGDLTVEGDVGCESVTASGPIECASISATASIIDPSAAQTVTNAQEVTLVPGRNVITPSGMANGETNVITVVNAVDGNDYSIVVASGSTNLLGIADSGNTKLSAAFNGDALDVLVLNGYGTDYVEVTRSAN